MPSDDYTSAAAGGALRIKGAKVKKHKKKKAGKSDLEKNLSTGGEPSSSSSPKRKEPEDPVDDREEGEPAEEGPSKSRKTDAERRFEEAKRKKLLELSERGNARPDLLKTHKERVEELNSYLSKLSEHHDMPKIGPG